MSWFRRSRRTGHRDVRPTRRERRAAKRTARAEASLCETQQKIRQLAAEIRSDLRESSQPS